MAITREEAIKRAKEINPKVNRAIEYKDAYGFENTKAGMHFGGNESFVILKESGDIITVTQYMYRKDHDTLPKRIPMKKNRLQVWLFHLLHTMRRSAGER